MLYRVTSWASAFVSQLSAALIAGTQGFNHVDEHGNTQHVPPNPSAMWPPHRPHPTFPRQKRGRQAQVRLGVVYGRLSILDVQPKLVGGKGLRP